MLKKFFKFGIFLFLISCAMQVHQAAPLLRTDLEKKSGGGYLLDVSNSLNFASGELSYVFRFFVGDQEAGSYLHYGEASSDIAAYQTFALPGGGTLYITGTYEIPELHYVGGSKTKEITICARAKDSNSQVSEESCETITFTSETNLISTSFTVGGTVLGLSGTLVLQNNGGDDLTLNSNGSFVFDTVLIKNATYNVTVLTSPWSQNCVVTHGSGTISASNISNVVVTCTSKSWHHPTSDSDHVSVAGSGATDMIRMAMDSSGNAILVWNQDPFNTSSPGDIFMSMYWNGVWDNPADLSDYISPNLSNGIFPNVAMDDNGNAIIVWIGFDGFMYRIFKTECQDGVCTNPSGLADNIGPAGSILFNDPGVAMDNNGNAIIVWSQLDSGGSFQIMKSEKHAGVWTHPSNIDDNISPDGTHATAPKVAMSDDGTAVVIWEQDDGSGDFQVYKSEFDGVVWQHPNLATFISPSGAPGTMVFGSSVVMDSSGNAIITWSGNPTGQSQIYKAEKRSGVWTVPSGAADYFNPPGSDASGASVAMNNNGQAVIVWSQHDGLGTYHGFRSLYDGAWHVPADFNSYFTPSTTSALTYSVAMNDHDEAIIVGTMWDGGHNRLFKSEYRGGSWGDPANEFDFIAPGGGSDLAGASVTASANGDMMIGAMKNDGAMMEQIFVSHFR